MKTKSIIVLVAAALMAMPADAQFLNRLADKALQSAEKAVTKSVEKSVERTTEKAVDKVLGVAEKAVDEQVDKAVTSLDNSVNEVNAQLDTLNAQLDAANQTAQTTQTNAQSTAARVSHLYGSVMGAMGAGTPVYTDKGDEVNLNWQYIGFILDWTCKFKGDKCDSSVMNYIFPTEELAIQFYREQIESLSKDEAKLFSVNGTTVSQDVTKDYADMDKIAVKAKLQQMVLSMGGTLQ